MTDTYCVYKHVFPNGKVYIGITCLAPEKRWGGNGCQYKGQFVHRAIQKYGWDNIEHIIVRDGLRKEDACIAERKLIKRYKANDSRYGYNLSVGGESGSKGAKFSDETRRKMSEAHLFSNLQEDVRSKYLELIKSGEMTIEECKRELRPPKPKAPPRNQWGENNHMYGYKYSDEEKEYLSKCHKSTRIIGVDDDGNVVYEFRGLRDAERKIGIKHSNLSVCADTDRKLRGLYWKRVG